MDKSRTIHVRDVDVVSYPAKIKIRISDARSYEFEKNTIPREMNEIGFRQIVILLNI